MTGGNVIGLGVALPEPYINRQQLADALGLSVDTVDRLVKQGMPSVTWGLRVRRFQRGVCEQWLLQRRAA